MVLSCWPLVLLHDGAKEDCAETGCTKMLLQAGGKLLVLLDAGAKSKLGCAETGCMKMLLQAGADWCCGMVVQRWTVRKLVV